MSKHTYLKTLSTVVNVYSLKIVYSFTAKYYGIPSYCRRSKAAFFDFMESHYYGEIRLDEIVVEWAQQGEIDRFILHEGV